jgi:hypothetical protein
MNPPEIRAMISAYYRIRELPDPLPNFANKAFAGFLLATEEACLDISDRSPQSRWARVHIGSVLSAALGAAAWMQDAATGVAALRMFCLAGSRALPPVDAWDLMRDYGLLDKPTLSKEDVQTIASESGLRLKLGPDPSPGDVLVELTRSRAGEFSSQVGHWIAAYFRNHATEDGAFLGSYRSTLRGLVEANERGELLRHAGLEHTGHLSREEWAALISGKIPLARLESRASYEATRQFLVAYWKQWQE